MRLYPTDLTKPVLLAALLAACPETPQPAVPDAAPAVAALANAGVLVKRVDDAARVEETVLAASRLAFSTYRPVAVLIGQRVVGFKDWSR